MNVSYSRMKAFERCPQQQKLIYVDKLGPEKEDKRRYIGGSTGHEFFTAFYKQRFAATFSPAIAMGIFDVLEKDEFVVWKNKEDRDKVRLKTVEDAAQIKEAVFATGLDKCLESMQNERWLKALIPKMYPHFLHGKCDIVIFNDDWVLDMKVTKAKQYLDSDQLIFYAMLYALAVKRRIKRVSFFVPLMAEGKKIVDVSVDGIDYQSMLDRIERYIDSWQHNYFPVTGEESRDCFFCDVKMNCPRYSIEFKINDKGIKKVKFGK